MYEYMTVEKALEEITLMPDHELSWEQRSRIREILHEVHTSGYHEAEMVFRED
jgi:hypothetical protein